MRIIELLEGKKFNESDFVKIKNDSGEKELDYDLVDDMIFFMNNNDDIYRKHVYPIISRCIKSNNDQEIKISEFSPMVKECYKTYLKEYPIKELPNTLDKKTLKSICEKFHEEVFTHIKDGKYK